MFHSSIHRPKLFIFSFTAIIFGVASHIPMYFHAAPLAYKMVGMVMSPIMMIGMLLMIAGSITGVLSILPNIKELSKPKLTYIIEDSQWCLTRHHTITILSLTVAIAIDVMKPATLGLVIPGMKAEYMLSSFQVGIFPVVALLGTAIGSVFCGLLGDKIGRKPVILLSSIIFIGTSVCGAMPSFLGNCIMCFVMGLSAGGLLPISFTMISELVPKRHSGWIQVLAGGAGASLGYYLATINASLFDGTFNWRFLWLAGIPSGLILLFLSRFIPESPIHLLNNGDSQKALSIWTYFGRDIINYKVIVKPIINTHSFSLDIKGSALVAVAIAWGVVNFGLILWIPLGLNVMGMPINEVNSLLGYSALLALPGIIIVAFLSYKFGNNITLFLFLGILSVSLFWLSISHLKSVNGTLVLPITLLLLSASAVISLLIPASTHAFDSEKRATGSGLVSAASKAGGILGAILGSLSIFLDFRLGSLICLFFVSIAIIFLFSALFLQKKSMSQIYDF
jgi:putative MFS transporter